MPSLLTSQQVRDSYLRFFEERGHLIVPSSSLIPQGDPTLLLTTAGMVQFKPYFTGEATPPRPRLASCQKCFRTTDVDSVGDTKHLTFFEMLGNFSIGDYFKKEAIAWAWEFVTQHLGLDKQRLWATVYLDDDEAYNYWRQIGVPAERIMRYGEKDNFWGPAGEEGPCGPCSEIHYDFGPQYGCDRPTCGQPSCPCGRFVELWNLVFTQYYQHRDKSRTPLPKPNIDTGMGLERATAIVQGKQTVFDTDLFLPIIQRIARLCGKAYGEGEDTDHAMRVVAEHARAAAFLIADGVVPDNKGRGYVLRKLIRRAVYFARTRLVSNVSFMDPTAREVIRHMSTHYPELLDKGELVLALLDQEEKQFVQTMGHGRDLLSVISDYRSYLSDELCSKVIADPGKLAYLIGRPFESLYGSSGFQGSVPSAIKTHIDNQFKQILGEEYWKAGVGEYQKALTVTRRLTDEEIFVLSDTYGFPPELTGEIAPTYGLEVTGEALEGFQAKMERQKEQSRAAAKFGLAERPSTEAYAQLGIGATRFLGYETTGASSVVVGLLVGNQPVDKATASQEVAVVLRETPFYGEGGGQVGDTGELRARGGMVQVADTQRPLPDLIVHLGKVLQGEIQLGDAVEAEVQEGRRWDIARNHTGTHLLHSALRQVLGTHVRQAGSLVAPDRLRFDFSHVGAVEPEKLAEVQRLVNEKIRLDLPVDPHVTSYSQAIAQGALAFFGEKYAEEVRVVKIGDDRPFSMELCGGTHCSRTGQIGALIITGESSIGSGMRRIEAVTGRGAEQYTDQHRALLNQLAETLETSPGEVQGKVASMLEELDRARKQSAALERQLARQEAEALLGKARQLNGVTVVTGRATASSFDALREVGDWLRDQVGSGIIVLGAIIEDKPGFLAVVTQDLTQKGYHAGQVVKQVAALAGGTGGGRPTLAQAGGKDRSRLDVALAAVPKLLEHYRQSKP